MKNRSVKKNFFRKIAFIILLGLILLIFLRTVKSLFNGIWDGQRRFTVVINQTPLLVFSIEPSSKRAVLLNIEGNTLLDVPYGYGPYLASSVYKLGSLDERRGGGLLLRKSIESTFGIITEGYISFDDQKIYFGISDREGLNQFKKNNFSIIKTLVRLPQVYAFFSKIKTNLSFTDIFRLFLAIRTLRTDEIKILDLSQTSTYSDDKLPDGTQVKLVNTDLFDFYINDYFQDQTVRQENISLELINSTGKDKVASRFGRILQNWGGNVVSKTSTTEAVDYTCSIAVSDQKFIDNYLTKRLRDIYNCYVEKNFLSGGLADIKITLGQKFLE